MGANTTIVNAAFKEAITRAGADVPDMSTTITGQTAIAKTYLKGVRDVFGNMKQKREELKVAQNTQLRAFKTAADKARAHLLDQEQSQPMKVHDAIYDKFKTLEEEFKLYNTTGDNDTADNEKMRANLYAQLQMITNQAVKSRGTIATTATMAKDVIKDLEGNALAIAEAIMSVDANYDNIELSFNEKGELVYHVLLEGMDQPVSWTIDEFNDKVAIHDKKIPLYFQRRTDAMYNLGFGTMKDFDDETANTEKENFISTVIDNDEKKFRDAAMTSGWIDSLYNGENYNIAVAGAEHLFTESMQGKLALVDVDGDGVITMADMDRKPDGKLTEADLMELTEDEKIAWETNIESIIRALTRPDNEAFNLDLSSGLMADYFVDGTLGTEFGEGRGHQTANKRRGGGRQLSQTQLIEKARAEEIDKIVKSETRSVLDMQQYLPSGLDIVQEGDEYVIYKGKNQQQRFNINDQKALRSYLYKYSGTDPYYMGGDIYEDYDYPEVIEEVPELTLKSNNKIRYGVVPGSTTNIRPKKLLAALQSYEGIDGSLKTIEDLQLLLRNIASDSALKSEFMKHINTEVGTGINAKHLINMLNDLIANIDTDIDTEIDESQL